MRKTQPFYPKDFSATFLIRYSCMSLCSRLSCCGFLQPSWHQGESIHNMVARHIQCRPNPPYRSNIMRVNPWLREDLYLASICMTKQLLWQQPTIWENRLLSKQPADHWKCAILRIKWSSWFILSWTSPTPQFAVIPSLRARSTPWRGCYA